MTWLGHEEFELILDEVDLVIEGHPIFTTFHGVVTFDCRKRVKLIERYDDDMKRVAVCPHASPALHKALLAAFAACEDEADEIIREVEYDNGLIEDDYPRLQQREFI